jgi:hypothetical protein
VKVIAVADSIKPSYPGHIAVAESQTELKVAVTVSGILYSSPLQYRVEIASFAVQGSGGHSHQGDRPTGRFIDGTDAIPVLYTQTTGDTIRAVYRASLFGGKEKIFARLTDLIPAPADTDSVVVRVPGLLNFEAGTTFELVGNPDNHAGTNDRCRANPPTSLHYGNHFGTNGMLTAIRNVAVAYDSLHPGIRLRVNDISLEFGGLFDTRNNWQTPHNEHRVGEDADIGFTGLNLDDECVGMNRRQLLNAIEDFTDGPTLTEGDHYHIRTN